MKQAFGSFADKPAILRLYTMNERAENLIEKVKQYQLDKFQDSMPDDRKGVTVTINGKEYVAAIRRLTPQECCKLQGVPEWYDWTGISDTQIYKMNGNGWQCDTIKHCWQYLPDLGRPLNVWSLFDGMSCASITLKELGIPVGTFISSEIDKHAIQAEKQNFPNMVQVGSVTDINVAELVEKYGVPDFLCGGSPCQSFSFSGRMRGMSTTQGEEIYTLERYLQLKKENYEFDGQSYLFWEFMRILTELREYNPQLLFFLENVEMLNKWERCLSHAIGVRGVHINSALVSAQNRRRIYWSNIRVKKVPQLSLFSNSDDPFELPDIETDIPQPEDRGIVIKDIIQKEAEGKYYLKDDTVQTLMSKTDYGKLKEYLIEPQFSVDDVLEYMNTNNEYTDLSDEQRRQLAEDAYNKEKEQLTQAYGA